MNKYFRVSKKGNKIIIGENFNKNLFEDIVAKQRKIADKFKKIADAIKIKSRTGEAKSQKEVKKLDDKKYKHDEVLDNIPDSSNSALF